MAYFSFTKAILSNQIIKVFNKGNMIRDFTYIDDIIESIYLIYKKPPLSDKSFDYFNPNPSSSWAPHKIFNLGNSKPVSLMDFIDAIEDSLGIKAKENLAGIQAGDVKITSADTEIEKWIGFKPDTDLKQEYISLLNGLKITIQ